MVKCLNIRENIGKSIYRSIFIYKGYMLYQIVMETEINGLAGRQKGQDNDNFKGKNIYIKIK